MASQSYQSLVNGDLSFTDIVANEVDSGSVISFLGDALNPVGITNQNLLGLGWGGFNVGVYDANSSQTVTINYTVTATDPTQLITSLQQLYVVDADFGAGTNATATEQAYDTSGNLVGTTTWSVDGNSSNAVALTSGYQQLNVVLTINESVSAAGGPDSFIDISVVDQFFGQTPVSQLASISSNVFCDELGTGVQAPGDFGLSGVTVELLDSTGTQVLQTTTTDANGNYSFSNLTAGTYETEVFAPPGESITTSNGGIDTVTLTPGESDTAAPTGLDMPAVFDVNVYFDANDNGVDDTGDSPIPAVTVDLLNGAGTQILQTATTDANGNVSFTGLTPGGSYEVSVVTPNGDVATQQTNVNTPTTVISCGTVTAVEGLYITSTGGGGPPPTPTISIDEQVVVNGQTFEVGNGVLTPYPTVVAGSTLIEQDIVTNSGTVALTNVVVTDSQGNTFTVPGTLAVGASYTIAPSETVTASNNILSTDTASVSGVGNGTTVTALDSVDYTGALPAISIDEQVVVNGQTFEAGNGVLTPYPTVVAGSTLTEQDIVTNTGTVALTNVVVTDSQGNTFTVPGTLAVGASYTIAPSETVTASNNIVSSNSASVTGAYNDNLGHTATVAASDSVDYKGALPAITIDEQVVVNGQTFEAGNGVLTPYPTVVAGSTLTEQDIVTNTGTVALTNVVVTDSQGHTFTVPGTLAVGASYTIAPSETVTASNNIVSTDSASVTGVYNDNLGHTATVAASDSVDYKGALPAITIDEQVVVNGQTFEAGNGVLTPYPTVVAGSTLTEQDIVTNTGTVALTNVVVTDSQGHTFTVPGTLAVGASYTIAPSETVTASNNIVSTDSASVTGVYNDNLGHTATVAAADSVDYKGALPAITIDEQVVVNGQTFEAGNGVLTPYPTVVAGSTLTEQDIVTNTGTVALTNVVVTDSQGHTFTVPGTLAVGASYTIAPSETVTASNNVLSTNTASVTGVFNDNLGHTATVAASDSVDYKGALPAISIDEQVVVNGQTFEAGNGVLTPYPTVVAGSTLTEQDIVTNTGTVALTNVVVTDSQGHTFTVPGTLAVGASYTIAPSETVTASNNILSTNTASVSGVYNDNLGHTATVAASDSVDYKGALPAISIDEQVVVNGQTFEAGNGVLTPYPTVVAGSTLTEQDIVTNTGTVALTNVVVTDSQGHTFTVPGTLAVGASYTIAPSETVTALNNILSSNSASVTGVYNDNLGHTATVAASDSVDYKGALPAITIDEQVVVNGQTFEAGNGVLTPYPTVVAGSTLTEQDIVTNTGTVALTNVVVTDSQGHTFTVPGTLAVGASYTIAPSETVTASNNIVSTDSASVTGVYNDNLGHTATVAAADSVDYKGALPAITIDEQVVVNGQTFEAGNGVLTPYPTVVAGSTLTEQDIVTNTGTVALTNVVVTDSQGHTFTVPGTLAVGASYTIAPSETVTALNNILSTNTASVTGVYNDNLGHTATVAASDSVDYKGALPAITIDEQVVVNGQTFEAGNGVLTPYPTVVAGSTLTEQDIVTNTGTVALTNVVVTDSQGHTFTVPGTLAVGASYTIAPSETVTALNNIVSTNSASVTGVYNDNLGHTATVGASDSVDYKGALPAISIDEQVVVNGQTFEAGNGVLTPYPTVVAGSALTEQDIVTNTGTVALTNVVVTDSQGHTFTVPGTLAVGASYTIAPSETVTALNNIVSTNSASVTGVYNDNLGHTATVGASDSVDYKGALPAISIDEQVVVNGQTYEAGNGVLTPYPTVMAGSTLTEQDIVTNTGTVALTNVVVTDSQGHTFTVPGTLAVGASYTIAPSETVTALNNIVSTNSASVTGVYNDNLGHTATVAASDSVDYKGVAPTPGISIVKTVTSVGGTPGDGTVTKAGEAIDYSIVVSNTGNETLTNVVVTDTTLGTTLGTIPSLAAGASVTYTAAQTVTQAEIDQIAGNDTGNSGSVCHTISGSHLGAGCTVWASSTFNPTSCANGATYTFQGISCSISGGGVGSPINQQCGNAIVTFSNSCSQASTVYNSSTNCWVTTLPANCNPGSVFICGVPVSVPYGCNLSNCNLTWSIGNSANNCGASNLNWDASCNGFNSFNQNGCNGYSNYNQIGVQSCDNLGGNGYCAGAPVNQCTWGNYSTGCYSNGGGGSGSCGGSGTVTCSSNVSGSDIINTAVVTDSQTPSATSTASTLVSAAPGVSIVKTVTSVGGTAGDPAVTKAGEVINYSVVVSNTGDETLTNVVVKDTTLGTTLGTLPTLAAGASMTYSASQTVTQAELDCGSAVTNTATVSDSQTPSASSTASTAVSLTPGISIVKTVTSVGGVSGDPTATYSGEAINYSVVVSNTGNETLTNVVVLDTTLGTTLGTLASLAAGASMTYTACQTVTQTELNSGNPVTNTATVTDSQNVTGTSTASTGVHETGGITGTNASLSVIKLPSQVVVGTCGQVTYTFDVTNTGAAAVTNVQLVDNIGTAASPDYITPTLQTATTNGVLLPGQTWVYTSTINEAGDYNSKGGSQSCSVSGQNLGSGCTAWLNSSFTPTSCKNGATYTFQNISCTISGPNCGSFTVNVPNACVAFSSSCTQASTVFNASENCWVTTVPANSNPGNVFLSGLPCQVPSGCNLSGATVSWNIGDSANNCDASNISWQTGCSGYNNFNQNGYNGSNDYNQIGVQVCDNYSNYGNGGYYGQNSNNCAGTPIYQYNNNNCGYGNGYGYNYGYGYGYNYGCGGGGYNNGGTCGNGGGGSTVSCVQLGDSSEADTATVTATTLSGGFSLGDAGNYGIIAFSPNILKGATSTPINGNVGVGTGSGVTYKLSGDKITGNLVTTGSAPSASSTGGTITGSITGYSSSLSSDISALKALSLTLASETGTTEKLTSGMTINATSGTLDSAGDYVFNITQWANNITINGTGVNNVVLNIASNVTPILDNVTLTGGLTANDVLFNDQDTDSITGTAGTTFNGTFLAPNATFNIASNVTIDGHLYGGASGQTFTFSGGATLNSPANTSVGGPAVTTASASDSTEVQVLASNSPITENGTAPTGSLASLYGTADKLEFTFNPGDTVKLGTGGVGSASLAIPSSPAFLAISNSASSPLTSGAKIYFEGEVQSGEKIYADATINQLTNTPITNGAFSTAAGADIYADIFASQDAFLSGAAPVATMVYSTSSSNAMHLGDEIGSLTLVGYVGANGGHLVS